WEEEGPGVGERRRVVAAVAVAAPTVQSAPWLQHAGDVAEPLTEQDPELLVRPEVVGQGPVLGPQLLARGLGLLRMPRQIEFLMVLHACEGADAGGDGIVRARLDFYAIRRVSVDQVDLGPVEQAVHVLRLALRG